MVGCVVSESMCWNLDSHPVILRGVAWCGVIEIIEGHPWEWSSTILKRVAFSPMWVGSHESAFVTKAKFPAHPHSSFRFSA